MSVTNKDSSAYSTRPLSLDPESKLQEDDKRGHDSGTVSERWAYTTVKISRHF